ncbi:MAG: hypothetical protein ACI35Q_05725 [Marinilabiliaceae bacterium]
MNRILAFLLFSLPSFLMAAQTSDSISNFDRTYLFDKCIKKGKVYPRRRYDKSFFDGVTLTPVPVCEIKDDSLVVIPCATPYLIMISRGTEYVGVLSTDDCGNSYIDIDYNYRYDRDLWPIWRLISSKDGIWVCNVKGINDQVVFTYSDGRIKYLDIDSLIINIDWTITIDKFLPYKSDEYPQDGIFYKNQDQNCRRSLRRTDWYIEYD